MGYNISRNVPIRMKRYLDDLLEAKSTISWPSNTPYILARKIREALEAVQFYDEFERYYELKAFYKIKVTPVSVEAEWKGLEEKEVLPIVKKGERVLVKIEPKMPVVVEVLKLTEITDIAGVVGSAITYGKKAKEIFFPDAILTEDEKETLFMWGREEDWKFIDHFDGGITLTRRKVESFLLWFPGKKESKEQHG